LRDRPGGDHQCQDAAVSRTGVAGRSIHAGSARVGVHVLVLTMHTFLNPEFGAKLVTLTAAAVLVLQIAMAAQRWLVTNIRIFGLQSFLLALIAGTIAIFNNAPHLFIAAVLTLLVKAILVPILLERLVDRIEIRQEIEPFI